MRRHLPVIAATSLTAMALGLGALPASGRQDAAAREASLRALAAVPDAGAATVPDAVDPLSWKLPEWMTEADYTAVPGVDWNDPALQPAKKLSTAMIFGDFQDRDFIVTMAPGSDHFCLPVDPDTKVFDPARGPMSQQVKEWPIECNPFTNGAIAREDVPAFYADFYFNVPSELNNFHTGNEFWLENSYGVIGVQAEGFGPYRMDGKEHEYGLGGSDAGGGAGACPEGDNCGRGPSAVLLGGFDFELFEKSGPDVTTATATNQQDYDFKYLVHAAYDESGTWQQFGEILFEYPEDVTDTFGPPNAADLADDENSAPTRYIEWTSWAAAEGIWSHAVPGVLSTQGESDGGAVFAHELSHIFGVLDNYNNPFGTPTRRSYTGLWANLSRGSFGGPGGHHNRWQIPPTLGASMPSHHMLRNKIRLGFLKPNELLTVSRDQLQATGPTFATVYPRAYPLAPITSETGLHGVQVELPDDRTPSCSTSTQYDCDGGGYDNYTIEFVDRIGFDSYTPDHGILLAKTKTGTDVSPFMWMIDSHPQDINESTGPAPFEDRRIIDFYRPVSGEESPISLGDARQLADGLFHAGTGEGVVDEYVDEANRLHFYVLDFTRDEAGVASYRVAIRHLDNGGPYPRGTTAEATGMHSAEPGRVGLSTFEVTNTGTGAADLLRIGVEAPDGWTVSFPYDVLEVAPGATVEVPVSWQAPAGAADGEHELTLTSTSETDPTKTATATSQAMVVPAGAAPVVVEPEPAPAPPPTPTTGGGAIALGLVGLSLAAALRRRN